MLGVNDLKRGSLVVVEGEPYMVMSVSHSHVGRGGAVTQTKIKNLTNGKVFDRNFKPSDEFEEAEVKRIDTEFIYSRNGEYWFHESGKPANRFAIAEDVIGKQADFLKSKMVVRGIQYGDGFIGVELPIKAEYKVVDAPPNVRGNTAQGGSKLVTIETGAKITTPMFVETGDKVRVNTSTGEYEQRVN